jgi:hypothetical protein
MTDSIFMHSFVERELTRVSITVPCSKVASRGAFLDPSDSRSVRLDEPA